MEKKRYNSKAVRSGIAKIFAGVIVSLSSTLSGDISMEVFSTGVVSAVRGIADIIIRYKTNKKIS